MKATDYWYFYLARCNDGSLYAGSTNDLIRRMEEHNRDSGVKYTRGRRPVSLAYAERFFTQGEALQRQAEVRKKRRPWREDLILGNIKLARQVLAIHRGERTVA